MCKVGRSVGVSAVTGAGCEDFEKAMADACKETAGFGLRVRDLGATAACQQRACKNGAADGGWI